MAFSGTPDGLGLPGVPVVASLAQAHTQIGAALPPAARSVFNNITTPRLAQFDTKIAVLDASKSVNFQRAQSNQRVIDLAQDAIDTPGRLEGIETEITRELSATVASGLLLPEDFDRTLNTRLSAVRRAAAFGLLDTAPAELLERVGTDLDSVFTGLHLDEPSRAAIAARAQAILASRADAQELTNATQEFDFAQQLHNSQNEGTLTAAQIGMCVGRCDPETVDIFAARNDGVMLTGYRAGAGGGTAADVLLENSGGFITVGSEEVPETGLRFPGFAGTNEGEDGQDYIILNLPGSRGSIRVPISRVDADNLELQFGDLSGAVPPSQITGTLGFDRMGEPVIVLTPVEQRLLGRRTRPASQAERGVLAGLPPSAQGPQDSLVESGPVFDLSKPRIITDPSAPLVEQIRQGVDGLIVEPMVNLGWDVVEGAVEKLAVPPQFPNSDNFNRGFGVGDRGTLRLRRFDVDDNEVRTTDIRLSEIQVLQQNAPFGQETVRPEMEGSVSSDPVTSESEAERRRVFRFGAFTYSAEDRDIADRAVRDGVLRNIETLQALDRDGIPLLSMVLGNSLSLFTEDMTAGDVGTLLEETYGFQYTVARDADNNFVVSFAQMDFLDLDDLGVTAEQHIGGNATVNNAFAILVVDAVVELAEAAGVNVLVTGHSLGGGLASLAARANNVFAMTFASIESMAQGRALEQALDIVPSGSLTDEDQIKLGRASQFNIVRSTDFLGQRTEPLMQTVEIEPSHSGFPARSHGIASFADTVDDTASISLQARDSAPRNGPGIGQEPSP